MKLSEDDILYEKGDYWVLRNRAKQSSYDVMKNINSGYAVTLQSYEFTPGGLSIAKTYCDYLARRKPV